ncbi:MAG TPA: fibronectin type III domain-containing protein, partial [Candidatus Binatia bacterium]|nr:fibronectin type III domain-containing protein [Candidatus Binatia bacterium]
MFAWLTLGVFSAGAFPVVTNVVETGGDNEATDTIPAKWTGTTFVTGIANEPVPGKGANDPYTAPVFGNWAPSYVDRNHRWTNASATVLLPPYLVGQEYIMIGNDNRDNPGLRLDVSVATAVTVYLLIDNRLGAGANDPPTFDATHMQWVLDEGWLPTTNGINRTANLSWPDEIGIDEGADATINNWSSIYYKNFPAGTFQLKQPDNAGQNMYGVVVRSVAPPNTPANLTAVSSDGKVTLNWTSTGGASFYVIKRSLTSGGPYENIATNSSTSYIDTAVVNDTTYYYVVSGVNIAGESANSNEATGTPKAAPVNLVAVGSVGQIQLTWDAFPNAASYTVSRSTIAGGPYGPIASGVPGASYTDTAVEAGRTYYYVVTAQLVGGGDSGQSAEASAFAAPGAPTLTVARWSVTGIELRWTSGGQNVSGYSVEQSMDGVNFTPLATTVGTQRTYVDAGLAPTTTYYYRVQAQNASGVSPYSNIDSLTTLASGFNVNFANALNGQPANDPAPIPPDYVQDIGEVYGLRTNGLTYGWDRDITADGRWRKNPNSPDLRWDTFLHFQKLNPSAIWEIEIPNGFYSVHIVSGDPNNLDSLFQLDIEGFITPVYS